MPSKENMKQNGEEILIVEDSLTQALQLQILLEENNYRVSVASDGVEALSYLREHKPRLIISDIVMPEMDGYELCRKVKSRKDLKNTPIMLLTELAEPSDIIKGLECGADNFVTKPYDEKLLLSRIQYILVNQAIREDPRSEMGIDVYFAGKRHLINSDRIQILDLLFSTYENSLQQKRELERANRELKKALETIKTLRGIIPICANCKKIRDDEGYWNQVEAYITEHSGAQFSHSICPECAEELYPEFYKEDG